jgi:hypothetical protein
MSGLVEVNPETLDIYFNAFKNNLPTPDIRRQEAHQYLRTRDIETGRLARYPSRLLFASQWAAADQEIAPEAMKVYRLTPTLKAYAGQTMLRVIGIHPDTFATNSDQDRAVMLDVFRIAPDKEPNPVFSFDAPEDPPADFKDLPFIECRVDVPVVQQQMLQYTKEHGLEVFPASHERTLTTVLSTTSCLHDSQEVYRRTLRWHSQLDRLVFSNFDSSLLLNKLMATVGGEASERYAVEVGKGKINMHEPLPDLSFLNVDQAA